MKPCIIFDASYISAANLYAKYKADEVGSIEAGIEDILALISYTSSNAIDDMSRGDLYAISTADEIVRHLTGYSEEHGQKLGYSGLEDVKNRAPEEHRAALFNAVKRVIYDVIEQNMSPDYYDGLNNILYSSVGIAIMQKVRRNFLASREMSTIMFRSVGQTLNRHLRLFSNPMMTLSHLPVGKSAMVRLAVIKEFSQSVGAQLYRDVQNILTKAESVDAFKRNKITRGEINRMIGVLDGRNYMQWMDMTAAKEMLIEEFRVSIDEVDTVYTALVDLARNWNMINYGKQEVFGAEAIAAVKANPVKNTMVWYLTEMRKMVSDYYHEVASTISAPEALSSVAAFIDATDLKLRNNYIPSAQDLQFRMNVSDLKGEFGTEGVLFTPRFYHGRAEDADGGPFEDFEMLVGNNIFSAGALFNRAVMTTAKVALDDIYLRTTTSGEYDRNTYITDALDAAHYLSIKLDRLLKYDSSRVTAPAKVTKQLMSLMSLYISGILASPANSLNNLFGGRTFTVASFGMEALPTEFNAALSGKLSDTENAIAGMINDHTSTRYLNPGLASEYQSVREGMGNTFERLVRKSADWLGDGGFMSFSSLWKRVFTVKGGEMYMRGYVNAIIYNRVHQELSLSGITKDHPDFKVRASALIEKVAPGAFVELSQALGHFDPLNKPIAFHLAYETAETLPRVLLGFLGKTWFTFRQVNVTNISNLFRIFGDVRSAKLWSNVPINSTQATARALGSGAFMFLLVLALWDLARDLVRPKEIDTGLDRIVDAAASTRIGAIESINPLREVNDLLKMSVFTLGILNVDDHVYAKWREDAIRTSFGMLGGMEARTVFSREDTVLDGITNLFKFEMDWRRLFSKDVIETGVHGQDLYALRRQSRSDLRFLRSIKPFDLAASLLIDVGMIGGVIKETDDPEQAKRYRLDTLKRTFLKFFGLSMWNDRSHPGLTEIKLRMIDHARQMRRNAAKLKRMRSAAEYATFEGNRRAYRIGASRFRRAVPPRYRED